MHDTLVAKNPWSHPVQERIGMDTIPNRTTEKRYRVHRKAISLIKFILEGYDGLAVVTTRNAARGEISVFVAPGCESQWHAIRADLSKHVFIQDDETRFS